MIIDPIDKISLLIKFLYQFENTQLFIKEIGLHIPQSGKAKSLDLDPFINQEHVEMSYSHSSRCLDLFIVIV